LILSGDHIYKMDYSNMTLFHKENEADVTVACMEVPINEGKRFGVIKTNEENRIVGFHEKPSEPISSPNNPEATLASMGIYIFKTPVLVDLLKSSDKEDFGKFLFFNR